MGSLPPAIREQVDAGAIAADTAYHLTRLDDPVKQGQLAAAVVQDGLTRDDVSAQVNALKNRSATNDKPNASRVKVVMELGAVTIVGSELAPERVVALLSELLKRARKAMSRGRVGDAFLAALREPCLAKQASSVGTVMPVQLTESA